jgi:aminopeptidase
MKKTTHYQPSDAILKKYADVLIKFALNNYNGIKKGDVVYIQVPECAKPMLYHLRQSVLEAGGHAIINYIPDDFQKGFYDIASDEQLSFFPEKHMKGLVDQINHSVYIIAETNKKELEHVPSKKIMMRQKSFKPYMEWRDEKENAGKFTWTLAMYATPQMAAEVNMSLEEYWQEIIKACFLDEADPVAKWLEVTKFIEETKRKLDALQIESVRVQSARTDLVVKLGKGRRWLGGSGRNIPSFELFISPDWRGTQGHIQFTEPLYRYGNLITDAYLEFKDGVVTKATATNGEQMLKDMIATENADKIGEFSLTDARLSKITKFMGETLFDENVGGKYGNTHVAIGRAYKDSYPGDPSSLTEQEWDKLGYNNSIVHTDIVSTENRTVTATLKGGEQLVIYKDGKFTI